MITFTIVLLAMFSLSFALSFTPVYTIHRILKYNYLSVIDMPTKEQNRILKIVMCLINQVSGFIVTVCFIPFIFSKKYYTAAAAGYTLSVLTKCLLSLRRNLGSSDGVVIKNGDKIFFHATMDDLKDSLGDRFYNLIIIGANLKVQELTPEDERDL